VCERKFSTSSGLARHRRTHTAEEASAAGKPHFDCDLCSKQFDTPNGLLNHFKRVHHVVLHQV
jgi:uncharacterized Zn-finger protein